MVIPDILRTLLSLPGAGWEEALAMEGFTVEHPIYVAPAEPGWQTAADGRQVWPLDGYGREGRRETNWFADGVVKYHRTLGTTLNTLIRSGFSISHVEEWRPSDAQVAAVPDYAPEVERPMFLLVRADRP